MINIIEAPENVAAFRATGEVTKRDYETILIPTIDKLVAKQNEINFLLVVDTSITNFTIGAFMKDLAVGLKHFTKWRKMAIVSESTGINTFTDLFSYVAPGEAKGFTHDETEAAMRWVSE